MKRYTIKDYQNYNSERSLQMKIELKEIRLKYEAIESEKRRKIDACRLELERLKTELKEVKIQMKAELQDCKNRRSDDDWDKLKLMFPQKAREREEKWGVRQRMSKGR